MRALLVRSDRPSNRPAASPLSIAALAARALVILALMTTSPATAQQATADGGAHEAEVTFSKDVAPILQASCQICHRPGSVGPMSLLTYHEVRRYASRARDLVSKRLMPPYHLDTGVGI